MWIGRMAGDFYVREGFKLFLSFKKTLLIISQSPQSRTKEYLQCLKLSSVMGTVHCELACVRIQADFSGKSLSFLKTLSGQCQGDVTDKSGNACVDYSFSWCFFPVTYQNVRCCLYLHVSVKTGPVLVQDIDISDIDASDEHILNLNLFFISLTSPNFHSDQRGFIYFHKQI